MVDFMYELHRYAFSHQEWVMTYFGALNGIRLLHTCPSTLHIFIFATDWFHALFNWPKMGLDV